MSRHPAIWPTALSHLQSAQPDHPVFYFNAQALQATCRRFQTGFPGLVTYAVKANDSRFVIENLVASGLKAFDVASPYEMDLVRSVLPEAVLHYNNPVRSRAEIAHAKRLGVASYSVDRLSELEKIADTVAPDGIEISVRLKLPVPGAAYDFGSKFGAGPEACVALLRRVRDLGYTASMTFHPGTQCEDPDAWRRYIAASAEVEQKAGVRLARLNVGGGFPAHRGDEAPDLERVFRVIDQSVCDAFGDEVPALLCEPGRAMIAEAGTLCVRVKAVDGEKIYLNDGIYGALQEASVMGVVGRTIVVSPSGQPRDAGPRAFILFGPTCDSLDRAKDTACLPSDLVEEDYILFEGMGAYSSATTTRFNGYGAFETVSIAGQARA